MIQLANKTPTVNRTTTSCSLSSRTLEISWRFNAAKVDSVDSICRIGCCYLQHLWQNSVTVETVRRNYIPHQYEPSKKMKQVPFEMYNVQAININQTYQFICYDHTYYHYLCKNTMIRDSFRPFIQHSSSPQKHCNTPLNCWADFWVAEIPGGAEGPGAWLPRPKVAHLWLEVTKPKPTPVPTPSAG